jgi:hypothetical protein
MVLVVDEKLLQENSRLSAVRLTMLMLRGLELWREVVDNCDKVIIILAVSAILGERFTRGEELEPEFRDLRNHFPQERLIDCNISSIAAATGFNRETTRRKVNELIEEGILTRTEESKIRFRLGYTQQPLISNILLRHTEATVRLVNDLMRDDLVRAQ